VARPKRRRFAGDTRAPSEREDAKKKDGPEEQRRRGTMTATDVESGRAGASAAGGEKSAGSLKRTTMFAYGSPGMVYAMFGYPMAVWIPAFYAGELGVPLALVGTVLLLARLTDVVTDPLVGFASDKTKGRFGRRKPWMLIGLPVMILGALMLFSPGTFAFFEVTPFYLLFWNAVLFLGVTLIFVPYFAWGGELSGDYHVRTQITAARETFVLIGLLTAAFVPVLVEAFIGPGPTAVVGALGWTLIAFMIPITALVLWKVPETKNTTVAAVPLMRGLKMVAQNGPMLSVLAILFIVTSGEAFRNALSLFFMRDIVGIEKISYLYMMYFVFGLLAIPFWLKLGGRIGKHKALGICIVSVATISAAMFFLGPGDFTAFYILFALKGICFGGLQFLPLSMIPDVVDLDNLRTGEQRTGTFFAISTTTAKLATAIGTGISLNVVAFFGFNPSGEAGVNGPDEMMALAFNYAVVPSIFFMAALYLVWNYPLTKERQAELRAEIERRAMVLEQESANPPQP
jgi:Na+/melibiose symporter-like transporter